MTARCELLEELDRHHAGDPQALKELVQRLRPWLWSYVRRKMGPELRRADASEDVVQDVLIRILERGPSFQPQDEDQLLRLVATMAMNRLRDRYDWLLVRGTAAHGVSRIGGGATPSEEAARAEERDRLELALALLDPEEAALLHERQWDKLGFEEIGRRRGINADTARMRHVRAVRRLGRLVRQLQEGDLGELAADVPPLLRE